MDGESLVVCVLGVGVLGAALLSGGADSAGSILNGGNAVKEMRNANALENVLMQTKEDGLAKQSEIALQRFQNGCTMHTVRAEVQRAEDKARGSTTVEFRKVVEGHEPRGWTGQYYSPGTVLCDNDGGTGIISDEYEVVDYAYTGQDISAYVQAYFQREGWQR